MKKIVFFLLMFVALFVMSCSTSAEKSIKELEKIVLEVESGSVDTEKEFEEVLQSVESLNEKYKNVEYTPEQQREVEALNTRLSAAMTEQFVGQLGRAFSGFMKGMVSGMAGFVDDMQELVDEIEEIVDDIDEM